MSARVIVNREFDTRRWLAEKRKTKPFQFCARADPKRVRADKATEFGHNYSCVIGDERVFFFERERARDRFCETYRADTCAIPECAR
jgi:hypothetical protein